MDIKEFIEKIMASSVLIESLVDLPKHGINDLQLSQARSRLGIDLNDELVNFLMAYDGANLDAVRFNSLSGIEPSEYGLFFASDTAGFMYHIKTSGEIVSEDTDGGEIKAVASSFNDFIFNYLFGCRSTEFCGAEWHKELVAAGVAT